MTLFDHELTQRARFGPGAESVPTSRHRYAAFMLTTLVVLAPFDFAIPESGFGFLVLRPLMIVAAVLSVVSLLLVPARRIVALTSVATLGAVWVSTALSDSPSLSAAASARITVAILVFAASTSVFACRSGRSTLRDGLTLGVIAFTLVGIATHLTGGELLVTEYLLGDISISNGVARLTRPFPHTNVAAMFLGPSLVLLAVDPRDPDSKAPGWATLTAVALAVVALSLTLSSGGLIAAIAGLLAGAWWNRSTPWVLNRIVPLLSAAYLAASRALYSSWDQRLSFDGGVTGTQPRPLSRVQVWEQAWDAFTGAPVFGLGPGQFGPFSSTATPDGLAAAPHAHSIVFEALATGGLVLAVPLAVLIVVVARSLLRTLPACAGISGAMVAVGVHSLVDYGVVFTSTGILIGAVAGALVGTHVSAESRDER